MFNNLSMNKNSAETTVQAQAIASKASGSLSCASNSNRSKKTKGRVKIKMEFIENKSRRYTTFSKRKTGIMKKAYELSTLTGTQVMLLVASETGHVYTFATDKLQPMITSDEGQKLIQKCLSSSTFSDQSDDAVSTNRISIEHFTSDQLYDELDEDYDDEDFGDEDDLESNENDSLGSAQQEETNSKINIQDAHENSSVQAILFNTSPGSKANLKGKETNKKRKSMDDASNGSAAAFSNTQHVSFKKSKKLSQIINERQQLNSNESASFSSNRNFTANLDNLSSNHCNNNNNNNNIQFFNNAQTNPSLLNIQLLSSNITNSELLGLNLGKNFKT